MVGVGVGNIAEIAQAAQILLLLGPAFLIPMTIKARSLRCAPSLPKSHDENTVDGQWPDLVLFDLDGTLVDSVPDLAAAVDAMLAQFGSDVAGQQRVEDMGR